MDVQVILTYGGFFVGLIGVFLSIYFFRKNIEKREPKILFKTFREIEKLSPIDDSNIQVLYKTKNVDRVFTSYLWIWNKGKKAINKSDIPPQSTIFIKLKDKEYNPIILDYRLLKTSREEININLKIEGDNKLSFSFDFLDFNDGAVIEIQHTGSYETNIETEGVILGVPKGFSINNWQTSISPSIFDTFRKIILMGRNEKPTRMFVKKSFRQRILFFCSYLLMLGFIAGFLIFFNYDTNSTKSINLSSEKLSEILNAEIPKLSDQNIQSIFTNAINNSMKSKTAILIVMTVYMGVVVLMVLMLIWFENRRPVPKSLLFERDIDKKNN
ncbi:MAG: hypothetical protein ACYDH2_12005 [Anaerolineaceae bacterium]